MWYSNDTTWGEYPPHFYGGEDEMQTPSIWQRKSSQLALIAGAIGLQLIAGRMVLQAVAIGQWAWLLLDTIGGAFIVACLLAVIVNKTLEKELLDDVVKASLGYILPPSLRPGMRWIYNQKIICLKHTQTVEIMPNPNDSRTVFFKMTARRSFRNVSNAPAKIAISLSIDELFADNGVSDIFNMGYCIAGEKPVELQSKKIKVNSARLVIDKVEEELLPSEDIGIDTWFSFQEVRQMNDQHSMFFGYATKDPEVTVEVPPSIAYDVGFQYAGDESTEPIRQGDTWKLPMTLLPKQAITIRWWERDKAEDYGKQR